MDSPTKLVSSLGKRDSPAGASSAAALKVVKSVTFTSGDINGVEQDRRVFQVYTGDTYPVKDFIQQAGKTAQMFERVQLPMCELLEKPKFVVVSDTMLKNAPEGTSDLTAFIKKEEMKVSMQRMIFMYLITATYFYINILLLLLIYLFATYI